MSYPHKRLPLLLIQMGWDGGLFLTLVAFQFIVAAEVPKVYSTITGRGAPKHVVSTASLVSDTHFNVFIRLPSRPGALSHSA